jgi:dihydroorotate dehydrogenase
MGLYRVLRTLLFALPPDMAHEVSLWTFRRRFWRGLALDHAPTLDLRTKVAGMELRNPFGLAAGFDKNADITAAMTSLGFGFLVVGSVRPVPHSGNPRPWFVRRLGEEGIVNSMGLPSKWAVYVRRHLQKLDSSVPLLLSIAGESTQDFVRAYRDLEGLGLGWEVNLSCPNTVTGRTFEEDLEAFEGLLEALGPPQEPTFLKLSPYQNERSRERALEMASLAIKKGFTGFTLCNTLPVEERGLGTGRGGLSGRPLFPLALQAVKDFHAEWGGRIDVIGVGGILSGGQALQMLEAGAKAVEVLTALILRGPLAVRHLMAELEDAMRARGFRSLQEVEGYRG